MTEEQFVELARQQYQKIKALGGLKSFYEYEKQFEGLLHEAESRIC